MIFRTRIHKIYNDRHYGDSPSGPANSWQPLCLDCGGGGGGGVLSASTKDHVLAPTSRIPIS